MIQGSCLCGSVNFQVDSEAKWVAHCHCTMCQRAHGAPFVTWVGVDDNKFKVIDDSNKLHWHESSQGAKRGFCSECGSTLFFYSNRWSGEMHITRANITSDFHPKPSLHAFYNTHVDWLQIDDDLKKIDEDGNPVS